MTGIREYIRKIVEEEIKKAFVSLPRPEARERSSSLRDDLDTIIFTADRLDKLTSELHAYSHSYVHRLRGAATGILLLVDSIAMPQEAKDTLIKFIQDAMVEPLKESSELDALIRKTDAPIID